MKSDIFNNELNLIKNHDVRKWTKDTLENAPDYFWIAQASSSGKYHPACTNRKGGLLIHVKRVVYLANRLCEGWGLFGIERDIVLSACILHDIAKTADKDFIYHAINAEKYYADHNKNDIIYCKIDESICHHMGRWTIDDIKKPIVDYSLIELAVYTCDYMATTKTLVTPVDNEEINV
ncbi:MAG: HD domain-containing protein [Novosphingobium sp.]|nr:HD domain-containing protein [Novosphingobium sp.]